MGGLKFVQRVYAYPSVTKYEVSKITLESWRRGGGGVYGFKKRHQLQIRYLEVLCEMKYSSGCRGFE